MVDCGVGRIKHSLQILPRQWVALFRKALLESQNIAD
jgi:hypothetical protein